MELKPLLKYMSAFVSSFTNTPFGNLQIPRLTPPVEIPQHSSLSVKQKRALLPSPKLLSNTKLLLGRSWPSWKKWIPACDHYISVNSLAALDVYTYNYSYPCRLVGFTILGAWDLVIVGHCYNCNSAYSWKYMASGWRALTCLIYMLTDVLFCMTVVLPYKQAFQHW